MANRAINLLLAQNAYSLATQVALQIFELSRTFPQGGPKAVRSRIISCSGNVCSYLSSAWQNKNTRNVFIDNLNEASDYAVQTKDLVQEALDFDFIDQNIADKLDKNYEEIIEKISEMVENAKIGTEK